MGGNEGEVGDGEIEIFKDEGEDGNSEEAGEVGGDGKRVRRWRIDMVCVRVEMLIFLGVLCVLLTTKEALQEVS